MSEQAVPEDATLTLAETLARRFHEVYERLAPSFGYETRTETRAFDPTTPNGRLMIAVCGELASLSPAAVSEDVKGMVERMTRLNVCDPGCYGRCKECPADVVKEAAALLQSTAEALETRTRERNEWREAEQRLGNAYLRLRGILKAFDTPYAPSAENVWAHTEDRAKAVVARAEAAEKALEEARRNLSKCRGLADEWLANNSPGGWIDDLRQLASRQGEVLLSVARIAAEAFQEWDKDNDTRVGKILLALSGRLPGYRADIDEFHAARALVQPEGA